MQLIFKCQASILENFSGNIPSGKYQTMLVLRLPKKVSVALCLSLS